MGYKMQIKSVDNNLKEIKKNERYVYLDGWRGLSILAVILGHFYSISSINMGRLGVEMFFVLSGRLMAEILFIKKTDIAIFLKRRISRVWPALFAFIIIIVMIFSFVGGSLHVSGRSSISALTFTYNYAQLFIPRSYVLDHIWSLCVEEHVYLLLALIAFLSRKYNLNPLILLGFICILFMVNGAIQTFILHKSYIEVYWRTDTRGASIIVSTFIFIFLSKYNIKIHYSVPVIAIFMGLILNFNFIPDPVKYTVGSIFIAIGLCTIQQLPTWILSIISHKFFVYLGLISFSLYLWQQPFYKMIGYSNEYLLLFSAFVISILSYKFIEVPVRAYLNNTWAR